MVAQEFQHLVHLIQPDARLALLKIADKPQPNARSAGELQLRESGSLAQFFDLLTQWFHVSYILYYIGYIFNVSIL